MAAGVQRALQSKSASAPRRHEQGLAVTSATLTAGGGGTSGLQRLHNNLGERALVGALAGGLAGGVTNGVLVRGPICWKRDPAHVPVRWLAK